MVRESGECNHRMKEDQRLARSGIREDREPGLHDGQVKLVMLAGTGKRLVGCDLAAPSRDRQVRKMDPV